MRGHGDPECSWSFNRGSTWHPAGLGDQTIQCLMVDPFDSKVAAGTPDGYWESTDDGASWTRAGGYLGAAPTFALENDLRSGQPAFYIATDRGVYSSVWVTEPSVVISFRHDQAGNVNPNLANQILPVTSLTFLLDENTFPDASPSKPIVLTIQLPPGALFSQTLAWADRPFPLAVSEYDYNADSGLYQPIDDGSATVGISDDAVEMYLYGARQDTLTIRINHSTSTWIPSDPDNMLGFTIGVGAGVWPPTGGSNWGADGAYRQDNTQFFADVRNFNFTAQHDTFPVKIQCRDGDQQPVEVLPSTISLFRLDQSLTSEISLACQMGSMVTDFTTTDLNADGREDVISIDGRLNRLYWILRQPDHSFGVADWREVAGDSPVTVEAADVDGDGSPEILVADAGGVLSIYTWGDLLNKMDGSRTLPAPRRRVAMAGVPTASLVCDVNGDTWKDFLYTDDASDTLTVAFGQNFSSTVSYPSGANPVALAAGDLDGDTRVDIAVANKETNSVTVYRNLGGSFQSSQFTAGERPVSLGAADFNRDGRADLAVALQGEKSLGVWRTTTDGAIDPAPVQKIFFVNEPSALQADNFDGQNGADVLVGFSDYYRLALCVSSGSGILSYAYSLNTLGDMELDPVNHVTLTENNVLSVTGGTSYGGVCSRGGVAALAEQPFNLVHLPRSQNLSFSVVNLDSGPAMLNLELYGDDGQLRRTLIQTIAPGQQFARYLTDPDLFGGDADNPERWVRAFLTQPHTYGFWLANDGSTLNYLDGLQLPDIRNAQSSFILPGGEYSFRPILLNPGQEQARIQLSTSPGGRPGCPVHPPARPRPGSPGPEHPLHRHDRGKLPAGRGGPPDQRLRAVRGRKPAGGPGRAADSGDAGQALLPAHRLRRPGGECESDLTLINPSGFDTSIVLLLYDDDGQLMGGSPVIFLPAYS